MDAPIDFAALRREREQRHGAPPAASAAPAAPADCLATRVWQPLFGQSYQSETGDIFIDGEWVAQLDPNGPKGLLDPDSENEYFGEEQDDHGVWHNAVWRNEYEWWFVDKPIRRAPSNAEQAAAAAVAAAGVAGATAAAVAAAAAAAAAAGSKVHTCLQCNTPCCLTHRVCAASHVTATGPAVGKAAVKVNGAVPAARPNASRVEH